MIDMKHLKIEMKKEHKLRYIYALDEKEDVVKSEKITYNKDIVYKKLPYFKPVQNYKKSFADFLFRYRFPYLLSRILR